MATQSPPSNDDPQVPGSESPKLANTNWKDVKEDVVGDSTKPSFVISEPLREDQVQNAVNFLSHPRVRGSPVIYRRSFLEKKGLTKEEIDEAFRRVPDPPSNATNLGDPSAASVPQAKPLATSQTQPPTQASQTAVAPTAVGPMLMRPQFHWSHALYAIGLLSASGVGSALLFKNIVVPRLKVWIRKVVAEQKETEIEDTSSSQLAEEAAEAAKTAASAADIVAKASQELLSSKTEERKYFEAFMGALDAQVKEMKSMSDSIHRLESRRENGYYQEKAAGEYIQSTTGNGAVSNSWRNSQHAKVNTSPFREYREVSTLSASVPLEPSATYSKPYMSGKISSVPQRMEKASGVMPREAAQLSRERDLQSQLTAEDLRSNIQETYGSSAQFNGQLGDSSEPGWQKKNARITKIESSQGTESSHFTYINDTTEKPRQRPWVPPQPPTVMIPEAAAAIRHPKPSAQKRESDDEKSVSNSENGGDGGSVAAMKPLAEAESLNGLPVEANQIETQEIPDGNEI